MQVSAIRIRDIENRWESLSLCLQAVARWAGVEFHLRSINAALGLSFMVSAPRDEGVSLSWWMTYGRDAFLVEGAALFGLSIRRLEVPEAFEQTSRPSIEEALDRNQPVLAWQGWPDYHRHLWGVVTQRHDSQLGFAGTTMWTHGALLPLAAPPRALYVVEEACPRQPGADELLAFSVRSARAVVHNRLDARYGVDTGLTACDRWMHHLAGGSDEPSATNGNPKGHYQMARFVTHCWESACRFLGHYEDGAHDEVRPLLDALTADCQGAIQALATSRDLKAVDVLYRSEDGRDALAAGVHAARDFLEAQVKTIDHLAEKLGIDS